MQCSSYDDLKKDIKQIYSLIDNLAEMNSDNRYEIKATQAGLHNTLRAIYSIQSTMLTNELSEQN